MKPLFFALIPLLAAACVGTTEPRKPTGGDTPTGDANPQTGTPTGTDTGDGTSSDGSADRGPAGEPACTPAIDLQAKRGLALALDQGRVLWLFDGPNANKGAGVSTCAGGRFQIDFFKSFGGVGDVPGMPWMDQGKIFIPYQTGVATNVVVLSNLAAPPAKWKVESHALALGQPVIGAAVLPPSVFLFTEPVAQTLKVYRLARDLSGALEPTDFAFPGKPHFALSLRKEPSGKWLALFPEGNRTALSRAAKLTGPWTPPVTAFEDKAGVDCGFTTELPMYSRDLARETMIAYSCADAPRLKFARISLP